MPFALFGSNPNPSQVQLDLNFSAVAYCCDNFTALRALPKTGSTPYAQVLGATTRGDGAGGVYYLDVADTSSADNGGSIIVATDGGRWKLATSLTTVATQAVANNSTSPASTAFVRQMGVHNRSRVSRTAAATLTAAADLGTLQEWSGTTAATLTLPAASSMPTGTGISFVGKGSTMATGTVARAGTDTITDGESSALTSVAISRPGQTFRLASDGVSNWIYVGPRRTFVSAWTATLPAASTAVTIAHGLGQTPSESLLEIECTTADGTYAVGDRILNPLGTVTAYAVPVVVIANATNVVFATSNNAPWIATPKTGGAAVSLTAASWKYRVIARV
jgi:hypothetical protein